MKDPRLEHFALTLLVGLMGSDNLKVLNGAGVPPGIPQLMTVYSVASVSFAKALIAALDAEERPSGYRESGR